MNVVLFGATGICVYARAAIKQPTIRIQHMRCLKDYARAPFLMMGFQGYDSLNQQRAIATKAMLLRATYSQRIQDTGLKAKASDCIKCEVSLTESTSVL